MAKKFIYIICTLVALAAACMTQAQQKDSLVIYERGYPQNGRVIYREAADKIIPDKVFEFGVPLLLIFMVLNTIVSIFKIRAEAVLKQKALDKGISDGVLIELFREDRQMVKNTYLKWFLVLAAMGIALMYVHFLHQFVHMSSGYLALGIICLLVSVAFLIYYRIIRKQK
jgi:hypothetical protein